MFSRLMFDLIAKLAPDIFVNKKNKFKLSYEFDTMRFENTN